MPSNTEDQTAAAMVRLGYALDDPTDDHRVLTFRAHFHDVDAAADALRSIGSYNDFDGEAVGSALVEALRGERYLSVEVGREGSPVVYVGPFFGGDDGMVNEAHPVWKAFADTRADEIDFDGRLIRAWWD